MTITLPVDVDTFFDGTTARPQLDHPEGVAVAADGAVWCGGERGQLFRISPDGTSMEEMASTDGFILGIAFGPDGRLFACDIRHACVFVFDPSDGSLETFAGEPGDFNVPNYPVVDVARGRLYVSDSRPEDEPGPSVWSYDLATGEGGVWDARPRVFANGMALTADRSELLVTETFASRVVAVTINDDGSAGATRTVVEDLPGLPDGLALDTAGYLHVGCYEPSRILRITPDGTAEIFADDVTAHALCHPTNLAFRGNELFSANLGRWHISRMLTEHPGAPLL